MKTSKVLILLAVALMAINPWAALAQNGPEMEEFVTENELLTLSYPAGWIIEEMDPAAGLPGIQMGNSEDALDLLMADTIPDDTVGIMVVLFPYDFLAQMSPEVIKDPSPAVLVTALSEAMFGPPEDSGVEVSEAEVIEWEEEQNPVLEVGYLTFSTDVADGAMVAYEGDGVITWLITIASPGDYTETEQELMMLVAGSVEYTGTADDLIQALLGGVEAQ